MLDRPSFTARFVAAARAMGALLPDDARLADDPFGARAAGPAAERLVAVARAFPAARPALLAASLPMLPHVVYMQVRTRLLDDSLRAFAAAGGRQVVLLGAGYDARAARFADVLAGGTVFEVDHPATQRSKRAMVGGAAPGVVYVAWDFERDAMSELPARLASEGHDPARPTLTIWEGVTMYLTEPAIEAAVGAVRAFSAPGSRLAFTYFDRARMERPTLARRAVAAVVAGVGEPFRWGWEPAALPGWLRARGFALLADDAVGEAAKRLLPAHWARVIAHGTGSHVAIAEPAAGGA